MTRLWIGVQVYAVNKKHILPGRKYGNRIHKRSIRRSRFPGNPLGPAHLWHHLHGDDCQFAIRLDAVRQPDRPKISLGARRNSGRLHDLRVDRDMVGPGRRLSDRPLWPKDDDLRQRLSGRRRLGAQCLR